MTKPASDHVFSYLDFMADDNYPKCYELPNQGSMVIELTADLVALTAAIITLVIAKIDLRSRDLGQETISKKNLSA